MHILWLYKYNSQYTYDDWLHMRFAEYIDKYSNNTLLAYGPDLESYYKNIVPIKYDSNICLQELYNNLKFDVVILNTKSRMFEYYDPNRSEVRGCWLPKDFAQFDKTPKIMIEEDYHWEKNDDWYSDMNIDLILQRHYNSIKRQCRVPMEWFPFSVDTKTFYDDNRDRKNRVCFAGNTNSIYPYRQEMINCLNSLQLIDNFQKREKIGQLYIECLRDYVCHLSCTSRVHITPAKMFEIMSSGSIMITNNDPHLGYLFDEGSYISYDVYDINFKDKIKKELTFLFNNKTKQEEIKEKARNSIINRHTHDIRINQLENIINHLQNGKIYRDFSNQYLQK